MTSDRLISEDPLAFIQRCVQWRKIRWTYHINMRLQQREISRQEILDSVDTFEITAEYPDDKYLPSYLVYFQNQGTVYHVL